jgi:hypothetical protein
MATGAGWKPVEQFENCLAGSTPAPSACCAGMWLIETRKQKRRVVNQFSFQLSPLYFLAKGAVFVV